MSSSGTDSYEVVWPLAPIHEEVALLDDVARSSSLEGRRIGFLWDYIFHGDEMFDEVKAQLADEDVAFVDYESFGNIHGHDERDVIKRLPGILRETRVDSVIVAVGA
jgi:hypothetical protein